MRLIDTHCHLNFDSYTDDLDAVIDRASAAGVTRIIIPAVDIESTREGLALASRYPGVYAAAGLHPNSSVHIIDDQAAARDVETLGELAKGEKIVAIGEIGLDYYWDNSPKEAQFRAFEAQLALASRLELPVIIHNRDASDDVIAILESYTRDLPPTLKDRPGVMHSFSASVAIAERALAAGFYLGFTGPITFKNADETRRVAGVTPMDHLLVETDGPFLTPAPHRGKRNEPGYIPYIIERLASIKQVTPDAMAVATTANAERLFRLPPTS
jgi:TatD DNase family protein